MSAPDVVPEKTNEPLPSDEQTSVVISSETLPPGPLNVEAETSNQAPVPLVQSLDADSDFQPLAANWMRMERRSWHILIGIVGGLLALVWLAGLVIRQSLDVWQWLWLVLSGALVALLVWCSHFFPSRTFLATSWRLHPHGVEIRRGVWWRHRIFVPKDRIQHTDVHQGPLQRAYGLASLVLNTGGTHEPSITLDGLDMPLAESLREQLSKRNAIQVPSATKAEAVA